MSVIHHAKESNIFFGTRAESNSDRPCKETDFWIFDTKTHLTICSGCPQDHVYRHIPMHRFGTVLIPVVDLGSTCTTITRMTSKREPCGYDAALSSWFITLLITTTDPSKRLDTRAPSNLQRILVCHLYPLWQWRIMCQTVSCLQSMPNLNRKRPSILASTFDVYGYRWVNIISALCYLNKHSYWQASTARILHIDHSKGHSNSMWKANLQWPLRLAFTKVVVSHDIIQSASTEVAIKVRVGWTHGFAAGFMDCYLGWAIYYFNHEQSNIPFLRKYAYLPSQYPFARQPRIPNRPLSAEEKYSMYKQFTVQGGYRRWHV